MSIKHTRTRQKTPPGSQANDRKAAARSDAQGEARKTAEPPTDVLPTLIVGIGASAGGLEAFKGFFANMPSAGAMADGGMAFVLVQHLAPQHTSMLTELIGRSTDLDVQEASDGERVRSGRVYVIPPDATLTIHDGILRLTTPAPPRQHRWPIDTFFSALAEDQGDAAVSIVLAGTGSDGAHGLRAIKEYGGLTLAQAGFDHVAMSGMPASAAATGLVDDVLPVEAMPARLLAHHRHLRSMRMRKGSDGVRDDVSGHLPTIARLLHADSGHDFSQYKEKTVVRRVQRRMQVLQAENVPDYIQRLREEPAELQHLFRELLISVTAFFRDPAVFKLLQTDVFPALLESKSAADTLRIWVPGCATGEEVYSIAIALKEVMDPEHGRLGIQIFATDIDDRAIAAARSGRFRGPLVGVSPERLERWFQRDGDDYVARKAIRELCTFSQHSAIKDPPFMRLDLISCRNVLIYMNAELQERLVRTFHYALAPGGFLLLGPSEGLSRNAPLFSVVDKKYRLYLRCETGSTRAPAVPASYYGQTGSTGPAYATLPVRSGAEDLIERNARRVLERHSPAWVVIDRHCNVLRFCGDTGRYLQPSSGAASLNLFALLHRGLRVAVRSAVKQAFAQQRTVVQDGLSLVVDGQRQSLQLIVEPLPEADGVSRLCVVAFRERGPAPLTVDAGDRAGAGHPRIQVLEQELEATQLQLQAAVDQQEIANEDLKSVNEEYQSVNEELQSSNEELETSKEEMQSINEELQVVNAELQSKNTELNRLNSDLRNLMDSTEIATLFLDAELQVTGFTPKITELFHLRQGDIGRPITEINARIPYPELVQDVAQVLQEPSMVERLLQKNENGPAGRPAFLLRIRPYRNIDNVIDGVVLTFTDITEHRRQELQRTLQAAIIDSSKDIVIGHDMAGIIISWNAGATAALGYSAAEAVGQSLTMLLPGEAPRLQSLLHACAQAGAAEFEMKWRCRDGESMEVAVTCSPIHDDDDVVVAGSLIARDNSVHMRVAQALQSSKQRITQLIEQTSVGIAETDASGRFMRVNPAFCELAGRSADTLSGLRFHDIVEADDLPNLQPFQAMFSGGETFRTEHCIVRPDGSTVWADSIFSLSTSTEGGPAHAMAIVQDISERRQAARHVNLMLGELNHRVKNTLASVQSIALQTLASASTLDVFKETFIARLHALSGTHNLLAVDAWTGVGLREIVLAELAPFCGDGHAQAELHGEELQLSPKTALALSMALHELTTNAVKYGALSTPQGRVSVRWHLHSGNDDPRLHLQWTEHDGPTVTPPSRQGFGLRLISDGLAYELDGQVSLQFDPDGVVCSIDIPLSEQST